MNIEGIIEKQRGFFHSNRTKDIRYRTEQLKKLQQLLKENESLLYQAINADFGKSMFDTFMTELSLVYHEINKALKNLKKWSSPKRTTSGLFLFPGKSYIIPEPLGNTLIIGAWNYPYQLTLIPAISALAAGNTVLLKPSEMAAESSKALAHIINRNFPSEYFYVIEGGVDETTALLNNRFDKIFFTGSSQVGKIIYEAASKQLTPVTLELGGKNPTFVFADSPIKMTAKRLVWAKFLNAGQTCVAPDYVLVESSIEQSFLQAMKDEIEMRFDKNKLTENYTRIINTRNFDRLVNLIDQNKIFTGGFANRAERYISPTILQCVSFSDHIMKDEIFGPILPVIPFTNLDETIAQVKSKPKPLACYIFSKDRRKTAQILTEISFGGGSINDSVMHLANTNLPFGGVGLSGIGSYHGQAGFDSFSHHKSIYEKPFWFELKLKYAPYSKRKLSLIKWLLE
ncbi:MAG: aldehyde dehydrogenase family protein [Bacteroidetes bacterium]|nr:aldehyde dehydrogenase family protein [Bacteroidota bacterium]